MKTDSINQELCSHSTIKQNNPFDVTMKFTFAVKSSQYLYLELYFESVL